MVRSQVIQSVKTKCKCALVWPQDGKMDLCLVTSPANSGHIKVTINLNTQSINDKSAVHMSQTITI